MAMMAGTAYWTSSLRMCCVPSSVAAPLMVVMVSKGAAALRERAGGEFLYGKGNQNIGVRQTPRHDRAVARRFRMRRFGGVRLGFLDFTPYLYVRFRVTRSSMLRPYVPERDRSGRSGRSAERSSGNAGAGTRRRKNSGNSGGRADFAEKTPRRPGVPSVLLRITVENRNYESESNL